MVRIDSSRSEFPPHIQPPIAHVPRAMREATGPDGPIAMVSIVPAVRDSAPRRSFPSEDGALLLFEEISNAMKTLLDVRGPCRVHQGWRRRMFGSFRFVGVVFSLKWGRVGGEG